MAYFHFLKTEIGCLVSLAMHFEYSVGTLYIISRFLQDSILRGFILTTFLICSKQIWKLEDARIYIHRSLILGIFYAHEKCLIKDPQKFNPMFT